MLASVGLPPVKYTPLPRTPVMALVNIDNFTKGAKAYGLPESALFQNKDLHAGNKGPFLNVVLCLNKLGYLVRAIWVYLEIIASAMS